MNSNQQNYDCTNPFKVMWYLLFMALVIWAMPMELILRRGFGRRYIDRMLFFAALWPPIFAVMWAESSDPYWGAVAFWVVILLGGVRKIDAYRLDMLGEPRHTQYDGQPFLCRWFNVDETRCKEHWEPLLCLALGVALGMANVSLGFFVAINGFAIAGKRGMIDDYQNERVADLYDAYSQQQALAERFRRWNP